MIINVFCVNLPMIQTPTKIKKKPCVPGHKKKASKNEAFLNVPGNVLLSHTGFPCSTIGAIGLNFRVRDGIGCFPYAIATGKNFWKLGQFIVKNNA